MSSLSTCHLELVALDGNLVKTSLNAFTFCFKGSWQGQLTVFDLISLQCLKKIGLWKNYKESILISIHQIFSLDNKVTVDNTGSVIW